MNDTSPLGEQPTFKPSVFYFRRSLRESTSLERATTVALIVAAELEQLKLWTVEQNMLPADDSVGGAFELLKEALRKCESHGQAILLGLFLCHELEQLKALVRWHGLIPPKWIIAPEEAGDKGWNLAAEPTGTTDEA
jgi:hypothetical protein